MAGHGSAVPASGRRPPGIEAAIFDMDGLLVDSEPLWRQAEMAIFERLGVALTEEMCFETRGMVAGEVSRYWYERLGWTGPSPEAVAEEIVLTMGTLLASVVELKPGAVAAVSDCRDRQLDLAVASSSPPALIEVVVDRMGLEGWFSVLHSAQQEKVGKPDPAVFVTTAALLGVDPGHCAVFEDSPAGVRAAVAAGMVCVAVPETNVPRRPGDDAAFWSADLVIDSLEEVDDELWGRLTGPGRP